MRRAGRYERLRYHDPHDKRLVQIIKQAGERGRNAVNILGVPFDGAVLGRRGAAEGPSAVRRALSGFSNYSVELGIGFGGAKIFDLGDVVLNGDDVSKAHRVIESEVADSLERSSLLVVVGGDNSLSLPALTAFAKKFGKIGLVVIDSHLDLRGRIDGKPTSGSAYGLAIETIDGLEARRVAEVGVHGFLNSKDYSDKAKRLGVEVLTAEDVRTKGAVNIAKEAYSTASSGTEAVYLSIDLDAVDLSYVSGVSAPSIGGMTGQDLMEMAHFFGSRLGVRCADIVELAPSLDPTGRSERVAAAALVNLAAGFLSRT